MKKITCLVLSMAMVAMLFVGCSGATDEASSSSDAGTETKKVACLIGDMSATYASWLAQSFEELAINYPDYEITVIDCENDVAKQIANLENVVAQKVDYVIIQSIDPIALSNQINTTIDAGIPVCVVNASNTDAERASCVDADPVEQGSVPAKVALENIPQDANVVILMGPSGNFHSQGRRTGYQETLLDARPDITILDEQIADWYKDKAMALMEDWLQKYPDIDAVLSMNDSMAIGAIEAAKAVGRMEEMTYYGVDGLADACLSIQAGELNATCVQNAFAQAEASLEIADKVLNSKTDRETVLVPGELITTDNVEEWIEVHTKNGQIK